MRTTDFSPLYRSVVGFDRLAQLLESAAATEGPTGYPPYNIERTDENAYRIEIAVAGFSQDDLTIEVKHAEGCAKTDDLELEFNVERFDQFIPPNSKRQKHMYGAEATAIVKCPCGGEGSADWRDSIQSSHMDEA